MTADGEIAKAKELLEAAGYVVLREKSHRQAQERQRVAEVRARCEAEAAEHTRSWARDCLAEERRLRERLTFVYGVAQAHGATIEELSSDSWRVVHVDVNAGTGTNPVSVQDMARFREALWER